MPEDERREVQNNIRIALSEISTSSNMTYAAASLDLMSYDIDKGTFDNLALLIIFATLVVVILLLLAFRNVKGVLFPFLSLNVALVWTYGTMNLFGMNFTALEVAVAPLVLGLGIDYAIHLQRALSDIKEKVEDTAEALSLIHI